MNQPPAKFWMVMRLSKSSETVQQIDSLPHKKYDSFERALHDASRLAEKNPNARGFVVLEQVAFVAFKPERDPGPGRRYFEILKKHGIVCEHHDWDALPAGSRDVFHSIAADMAATNPKPEGPH